jgi:hypothetical protein
MAAPGRFKDAAPQLVYRQPAGVDDLIGEAAQWLQDTALVRNPLRDRLAGIERVRASRFAEPPQKRAVIRFQKHEADRRP